MSTLDKMSDLFSDPAEGGSAAQIISSLMNQPGGLTSILAKLEAAGQGEAVRSWIGRGENQPINGKHIQNALGNEIITKLASSAGVSPNSAASMIARFLPQLVNKLTPNGHMPAGGMQGERIVGALTSIFQMNGNSESPYRDGLPRA